MISILDKKQCCGCSACVSRCPQKCIKMHVDKEGFLYPKVDETLCIDCGLCDSVCLVQNPYQERIPLQVLASINLDETVRLSSSSGGIFSLLSESIIHEGGVVFGARFDEKWQVVLDFAESIEGVSAFRGAKYVQARIENAYSDCERFLKKDRKVLFSGTPCQIAGLKHYLHKDYLNLITVDIVCHGVPSPKVWNLYLNEVSRMNNKKIQKIQFRNKSYEGWNRYYFVLDLEDDDTNSIHSFHGMNPYMKGFLSNLTLRPSCYDCKAKSNRSHSDITIADYWGIELEHPEIYDDRGTGLVLLNTCKGTMVFNSLDSKSIISTYEQAVRKNPAFYCSVKPHPRRDEFFDKIDEKISIQSLIIKITKPCIKKRLTKIIRIKHSVIVRLRILGLKIEELM